MVSQPHGIRIRLLVAVTVVTGALAWIALRLWSNAGHLLPQPSWAGLPLLVAVAIGLYLAGRPVKKLVAGQATKPVHPLYAARVLVLAQAAALAGATVLGWYLAQVVLLLPDSDVESQQNRIVQLGALGLGSVLLAATGLVVQKMCRVDDRGPREDEEEPAPPRH